MAKLTTEKKTGQISDRVRKLREEVLHMPQICIERGMLWTESYKETEREPSVIRRARALAKVLNKMSVIISDGELIVGRTTSKPRGGMLIPEVQWEWYLKEIDLFSTRPWDRCAPIPEEDKVKMREFLPYWKEKCLYDRWEATLPEDVRKIQFDGVYVSNTGAVSGVHLAHPTVDYEKVLTKGLNGIISEVNEEIDKLDLTDLNNFAKYHFLRAINITLQATIDFAGRYARLAQEKAAEEPNPRRKAELETIADICRRVPADPARNFWEALQSFWFVYIVQRIEGLGPGLGIGRADQYFYPLYNKDIEEGTISREKALELVELLLVKINDTVVLMSSVFAEQLAGFPTLANIILGGETLDGKDAVNELSYLFLDAEREVGMTVEEIVVRVNKKNPDTFLMKACEVNKALTGKFKFLSDNTAIQQMMVDGKPNARDYVVVGCYTPTVPVYSFSTSCCMVNIALMLELALNNGVSRLSGKQFGPKVGDARKFASYEEVWNAFKETVDFIIPLGIISTNADKKVYADYSQYPFQSALLHGLIQKGIDVTGGGMAPYATQSHGLVGAPNVGDSLAAIKKVVFDDKKFSMARLIDALDRNFEGEEELLYLLTNAPKFGNGDPYVDTIVNDVCTHFSTELSRYPGIGGTKHVTAAAAGTGHLGLGQQVGALPDGRKSGEPLSEGGISPYQGRNVKGLTATLRSVSSLDHLKLTGGSVLNM
ncbi:MAG TPA: pyruvate formate lyase family protein, partial [Dehalococcoidia bacterium]|nr:pyruvate formate lyase family protein [Dehalococcoidia bacterium]